jgi:hypothetical protein
LQEDFASAVYYGKKTDKELLYATMKKGIED